MTTPLLDRPRTATDLDAPLRALTVRQPWAWAIAYAGKRCENRTRSLGPYRGQVAIHAGLGHDHTADRLPRFRGPREHVYGAVVALADLVDVHGTLNPTCCQPWGEPGAVHHVLSNVHVLLEPVPARGALGLWTVAPDLARRIRTVPTVLADGIGTSRG